MWVSGLNATLLGLVCALTLGCGGRTHGVETGGETGFLEACGSDADCQSGLCACGVCSRTCEEETDCNDSRATCVSGAEVCDGESRAVCLQKQASTEDASVGFQTTGQSTSSGSEDCHGPGHYEAGKGGEYRPCCEGLTEVLQLGAAEGDDGPVCVDLPLRVYACVEGTCGDGVCEVGEDVHCGCVDDCPGAAWGASDSTASDGTQSVSSCEDFSCEVELLSSSLGSVEVSLEVDGSFCPRSSFSGSALRLFHAASGKPVLRGQYLWCGSECPPPVPPVAPPPEDTKPFTWDGSVMAPNDTLACADGARACQTEQVQRYASSDRYIARACSYCEGQGEFCAEQAFDYPETERVVIQMINPLSPTPPDAGGESSSFTGVQTISHPEVDVADSGADASSL